MTLMPEWRSVVPSFMVVRPLVSKELKYTERQKFAYMYKIAGLSFPHYCDEVKNIGLDS